MDGLSRRNKHPNYSLFPFLILEFRRESLLLCRLYLLSGIVMKLTDRQSFLKQLLSVPFFLQLPLSLFHSFYSSPQLVVFFFTRFLSFTKIQSYLFPSYLSFIHDHNITLLRLLQFPYRCYFNWYVFKMCLSLHYFSSLSLFMFNNSRCVFLSVFFHFFPQPQKAIN